MGWWVLDLAKEFSSAFYKTKTWQNARENAMKKSGRLCVDCLKNGKITDAEIVHHIIELTPGNITNPEIAYGLDNLCPLCRECHAQRHGAKPKRYDIGPDGRPIIR